MVCINRSKDLLHFYPRVKRREVLVENFFTNFTPSVKLNGRYPLGHPFIFLGDGIPALNRCEGLLKCTVLPPKGLYLPVLPYRTEGKLYFPLCRTCVVEKPVACSHSDDERTLTGTWVTCELQKAVSLGYKIVRSFELWHYPSTTQYDKITGAGGLFAGYVNMWLKIKQESSGWPRAGMTEVEKRQYISAYKENEGVVLEYDNIKPNPDLRQIAKLSLNSLWDKLGQRADLTKTEILNDPEKWFGLLYDPNIEVKSFMPVNEDVLIAKWTYEKEVDLVQRSQNVVIAAYTTAMVRLKLYSILEQLQQRVLYFDTDSVIYTCGPGETPHPLGDYLGELTDEVASYGPGAYICEFASGGPKNYGYLVSTDGAEQETFKCKGIRLNYRNGSLVNFNTLKAQLGINSEVIGSVAVTEPRGIVRYADHTVVSKRQTKTYRVVFDKRQRLDAFKSLPWGF